MGVVYVIQPDRRLVVLTGDGKPDLEEFGTRMAAVVQDQFFEPGYGFLFDIRARTSAPSRDYVERQVSLIGSFVPNIGRGRWALLCMNEAVFGMARMAEVFGERHQLRFRAFRPAQYREALHWAMGQGEAG